MVKAIERVTGNTFAAQAIEGGYQVYTLEGEKYKKLKDSTFKKYFKLTGETITAAQAADDQPTKKQAKKADTTKKAQAEATEEQPKAEKKETKKTEKTTKKAQPEEAVEELTGDKREKMIETIKKVLKLAKDNPSMEEGLSAALKAQKLMAKYNIHEEDVALEEIKDQITSVFSSQTHNSHLRSWRKALAVVVAENFRCKTYLHGDDVVFRGYTQDAKIALDVYMTLYTIGHKLARAQRIDSKNTTGNSHGVYNSFIVGFLTGLKEGFGEQCTALMIVTPKEVTEEFEQFSANFQKSKTNRLNVTDIEAYAQGKVEGKAAVKARTLSKKGA